MRKGKGKPGCDPHGRFPDFDVLELGDELENGAAFSAIAEAAPGVVLDVDDELLVVAAVVDRATGAHGVARALQLAKPSVMIQDHDDGNASIKEVVVYEDVVVLAHFKEQSSKLETQFKRTISLYVAKGGEIFICMAVTIARAGKARSAGEAPADKDLI